MSISLCCEHKSHLKGEQPIYVSLERKSLHEIFYDLKWRHVMNKVCCSLNAPMCKQAFASQVVVFQPGFRWVRSYERCLELVLRYRITLPSEQPASPCFLPSWQRKQKSQHHCPVKSASFSCTNWGLQILQARAVQKTCFPWNNSLFPPFPPTPKNYLGHMFCKKHFSQKQHLLWNRTCQLSLNATLNVRF